VGNTVTELVLGGRSMGLSPCRLQFSRHAVQRRDEWASERSRHLKA